MLTRSPAAGSGWTLQLDPLPGPDLAGRHRVARLASKEIRQSFPTRRRCFSATRYGWSGSGVSAARSGSARTAMTWPWVRWTWARRIGSQAAKAPSSSAMRVEAAAGEHVVADDDDLPFDPALPGRPVGGQHVDGEPVMVGERGRLRMQRHRQPGCDVASDDGLGAVVDDAARARRRNGRTPAGGSPRTWPGPCWW